jgi:hypothetical protein
VSFKFSITINNYPETSLMFQQTIRSLLAGLTLAASSGIVGAAEVKPKSFDEVQAEARSLKAEKVAWRKIAWKTCLLDGLKASQEQKKPLMLWIFIDRPIDDERC